MRHRSCSAEAWLVAGVMALLAVLPAAAAASRRTPTDMPKRLRIALVPLDDRPVCLQYPQMLAGLAHAEVVAPPRSVLGRFTTPGDTAAIARWLRSQNWASVDALIVSVDMLAYGGLVASRLHQVDTATALARLGVLREIHAARSDLPIYASSVIMRLAPTADGTNDAWRDALARYAELAAGAVEGTDAQALASLGARIPAAALADYTRARTRNRQVNLAAVDLVAAGVVTRLVVSQDDAKPRGLHVADREAVGARVREAGVDARVGVQPGADEVSMLLLARAVLDRRALMPTVRPIFSSERAQAFVAPYEDRPLEETVRFQLSAAGARVVLDERSTSDLDLFVFASRDEAGAGPRFAERIAQAVAGGRGAIVADVDPRGDVQGASAALTEPLLAARVFPRLSGYASWNTAGNTVGTAVAHGLLAWAGATLASRCTSPAWSGLAAAQVTFLLHRLVNDYAYQGLARPALNRELRAAGRTAEWIRTHAAHLSKRLRAALLPRLETYAEGFTDRAWTLPSPTLTDVAVQVSPPRRLAVTLPWNRTFEAAITFDVTVGGALAPHRRPVCVVEGQ